MNGNELILLRKIEDLENYIKRVPEVGGVWQDWTPDVVGFSSTTSKLMRFCVIGKFVSIVLCLDGTSNSVNFNCTLPFTAKDFTRRFFISSGLSIDNTTVGLGTFRIDIGGVNVVDFIKGVSTDLNLWPATGRKYISGQFFYEIA